MEENNNKHFERPTVNRPPALFNLVILTVIIGLLSGAGGYFIAQTILPKASNGFDSANFEKNIQISLEQPLTNVASKYQKSIAGVYSPVLANTIIGEPLFSSLNFLGSAVVVTSDGWLMTTDQVVVNSQAKIVLGDDLYDIQEMKKDEFTKAVFVKIEANFLQPIDFQLTDNIKIGEQLFTNIDLPNSSEHNFYTSVLANSHYTIGRYLSTDSLDYYLQILDNPAEVNFLAAPYFNMDGNLMGLTYKVNNELVLLPSEYLKQAVKNLLNNTTRVSVGINYVDLENNSGFVRKGVLVFHPTLAAVQYNSPAYIAGLRLADQIVAVNNDVISSYRSLTSILQNYRAGDKVIMKIFRDGTEQDIEVEL